MEPSWKQADVFPVIARVIEQAYRERQRFLTTQEIAAAPEKKAWRSVKKTSSIPKRCV